MVCLYIEQPASTRCKSWWLTLGREMYQIQLSLPLWIKEEEGEVFILLQFCSPKCEIIELVIFLFVRLFFVSVFFLFPMWEKVIQGVNSAISLNEDSAFVNICSLVFFQDQPDRSSCPCLCARLPVTKPYFFQYLCFYQHMYFWKPALHLPCTGILFPAWFTLMHLWKAIVVLSVCQWFFFLPSTLLRQKTVLVKI